MLAKRLRSDASSYERRFPRPFGRRLWIIVPAIWSIGCGGDPAQPNQGNPPGVAMVLSPSTVTVAQGSSAPFTIGFILNGGYAGPVYLAFINRPSTIDIAGPPDFQLNYPMTVTVGNGTPIGIYNISIVASGIAGVTTDMKTIVVIVTPAPTPRAPALKFTITPNPIPSTVSTICLNSTGPTKVWIYTLRIENTGELDYVVLTATQTYTVPGISVPVSSSINASSFATIFGTRIIPAAGAVQATLCAGGGAQFDNASFSWTIAGVVDGTFTSPTVVMLP